jgi:hypothetical protein
MTKSIEINGQPVGVDTLSSFAFSYHNADPQHPQYEEHALLKINGRSGNQMLVKGGEAVTLKVLLASLGLPDLSTNPDPSPDPRMGPSPSSKVAVPEFPRRRLD